MLAEQEAANKNLDITQDVGTDGGRKQCVQATPDVGGQRYAN